MSAYVVNRNHIWYLIQAATSRVLGMQHSSSLYWYHNEVSRRLSCTDYEQMARIGQMLWDENVASVKYRYPDCGFDELPGPIDCDYQYGEHNGCGIGKPQIDPVAVLKACDGYEYQSCEHPSWEQSEAHTYIQSLRSHAWHSLPGYDGASWEIA